MVITIASFTLLNKIYHTIYYLSMCVLPLISLILIIFLCKTVKKCYNEEHSLRRRRQRAPLSGRNTRVMWKYFGVLCNVATVLLGCCLGLLLRRRAASPNTDAASGKRRGSLPPRDSLPEVMMQCLGFCTIFAAASGLLGIESGAQALIAVVSMAAGFLVGWALRVDDRLNLLGERILEKTAGGSSSGGRNPAEGVVTATLLFCVGSMTILGSFESAANPPGGLVLECHTTLLIKSLLDFVSATCLSVTFGVSVVGSALFVLVFQGALVLLASSIQPFLEAVRVMPVLNCVGSLILLGIAMNLIGIKKIKTADYLPALVLPILICWLLNALR